MYFFLKYTTKEDDEKIVYNDKFRNIFDIRRAFLKVSSAIKNSVKGNSTSLIHFRVFDDDYKLIFESTELNYIETYINNAYEEMIQTTREIYRFVASGCDERTDYKNHTVLENFSEYLTIVDIANIFNSKNTEIWDELTICLNKDFDISYEVARYEYGKLIERTNRNNFMDNHSSFFRKFMRNTDV